MSEGFKLRRGNVADSLACYDIFHRSLHDLFLRLGIRGEATPRADPMARWPEVEPLFAYLAASASQWWIAENDDGEVLGYARAVEHSGTVELSDFFVDPNARVSGLGRQLLERTFAPGVGERRLVIATLDAPAVSLYLRFGVTMKSATVELELPPAAIDLPPGYSTAPATLEQLLEIERSIFEYERREDLTFMLENRPAVILLNDGQPVGYAFLTSPTGQVGPVATIDPMHMPAALCAVETSAHEAGLQTLRLSVPMTAQTAMTWLLGNRKAKLDPFYQFILANGEWIKLDRYLPFNPSFIL